MGGPSKLLFDHCAVLCFSMQTVPKGIRASISPLCVGFRDPRISAPNRTSGGLVDLAFLLCFGLQGSLEVHSSRRAETPLIPAGGMITTVVPKGSGPGIVCRAGNPSPDTVRTEIGTCSWETAHRNTSCHLGFFFRYGQHETR